MEWRPGSGPIINVWDARPAGHKCIWTARWSARSGVLEPEHWHPLEKMTRTALAFEMIDFSNQGANPSQEARRLLSLWGVEPHEGGPWRSDDVREWLRRYARPHFVEYIAPWDPPAAELIQRWQWRPGWSPKELGFPDPSKSYQREVVNERS